MVLYAHMSLDGYFYTVLLFMTSVKHIIFTRCDERVHTARWYIDEPSVVFILVLGQFYWYTCI